MSSVVLPELDWLPTTACGDRRGSKVELVVVHRWGAGSAAAAGEAKRYQGVLGYFRNPANKASAHVVYPGSAVSGKATQMVAWRDYAWTEAAYNPVSVEVEAEDRIFVGDLGERDDAGFEQLARIVAFLLHSNGLPAVWSHRRGFCRHADLGAAGGGHTSCPTTDLALWRYFCGRVVYQYDRGGFVHRWGR